MHITRHILLIFIFTWSFYSMGQKRIGVDVSSRMNNLMFTAHYQQVLKNHVLYSAGIFAGGHGSAFMVHDTMRLYNGNSIATPYTAFNRPVLDSITSYHILDYKSSAQSIGIQFGLGYYFEFGVEHGLRINVNSKWAYVNSTLGGYFRSLETNDEVYRTHSERHFVGSVSLEAYHTIRMTRKLTFNYGLKVPYFYTIDKARFNPSTQKDLMYGFKPEISIGFTRVIGKCE